ncbi:MAG: hypothetical protein WC830_10170 [Burkholderiales bacterium]|jgi:hypothetical protein
MSNVFDLDPSGDALALETARHSTFDNEAPGIFSGVLSEPVKGIGKTVSESARMFNLALSHIPGAVDAIAGTNYRDWWFEHMANDQATKYFSADPNTTGMAGQVLNGFFNIGSEAVAGLPALVSLQTINRTAQELDRGVDLSTAGKLGLVQAGTMAAGVALPFTLPTVALGAIGVARILSAPLVQRLGYGVASNLPLGVAQRGVEQALLAGGGYKKLAEEAPGAYDPRALMVDTIMGLAFGAGAHAVTRLGDARAAKALEVELRRNSILKDNVPQDAIDSALVVNAALKAEDSAPGVPRTLGDKLAHDQTFAEYTAALTEGRPVNPENLPLEPATFVADPRVSAQHAQIQEELAPLMREQAHRETVASLRAELLGVAGERADPAIIAGVREERAAVADRITALDGAFQEQAKLAQAEGMSRKRAEAAARERIAGMRTDLEAQASRLDTVIAHSAETDLAAQHIAALDRGEIPARYAQRGAQAADERAAGAKETKIGEAVRQAFPEVTAARALRDQVASSLEATPADLAAARGNAAETPPQNASNASGAAIPDAGTNAPRTREAPAGGPKPQSGEAIQPKLVDEVRRIAQADPNRMVVDADGELLKLSDALQKSDEVIAQADADSRGFLAAALCFLGGA